MTRTVAALAALLLLLLPALAADKVVGARWEFTAYGPDEKVVEENTFRATPDFKIYKGARQIGTWRKVAADKVVVEIAEGMMKGTMELTQTDKKPPIYHGPWIHPDGTKSKGKLKMLED
jgi:hypothetical protein